MPAVLKRYLHKPDAVCGMVLLLCQLVCVLMIVAGAWWLVGMLVTFPEVAPGPLGWCLLFLPYLFMITAIFFFRHNLVRGSLRYGHYLVTLSALIVAFSLSFSWFINPMHDIALAFGSHGRFGCTTMGPDDSPYLIIRDTTLPWLVFGVPIAVLLIHFWLWNRRRRVSCSPLNLSASQDKTSPDHG